MEGGGSHLHVLSPDQTPGFLQLRLQAACPKGRTLAKLEPANPRQDLSFHLGPNPIRQGMKARAIAKLLERNDTRLPMRRRRRQKTRPDPRIRPFGGQFAQHIGVEQEHGRSDQHRRLAWTAGMPLRFQPFKNREKRVVRIQGTPRMDGSRWCGRHGVRVNRESWLPLGPSREKADRLRNPLKFGGRQALHHLYNAQRSGAHA